MRQKPIWYVVGCIGLALPILACLGLVGFVGFGAYSGYDEQMRVGNRMSEASALVPILANNVTLFCPRMHEPGTSPFPDAMGPTLVRPGSSAQMPTVDPRWHLIEFGPNQPQYYAYSIERPDASSLRVVAEGDLDDDGVRSRYAIDCTATGPSTCTCGEMVVTNPME